MVERNEEAGRTLRSSPLACMEQRSSSSLADPAATGVGIHAGPVGGDAADEHLGMGGSLRRDHETRRQPGASIRLADDPKSGGEGRVHGVIGSPNLVAKIYHSGSAGAEPEKLRLLIAAKDDALLEIAAWPTSTLHEKKAKRPVVGFLMPKISGFEEIHKLYGPEDRLQIFPDADWRMFATAAMNLAAAFQVVHERGFLIADVNELNTFVAADGSIRLIDCDSFQVRTADGRVLRCGVGSLNSLRLSSRDGASRILIARRITIASAWR